MSTSATQAMGTLRRGWPAFAPNDQVSNAHHADTTSAQHGVGRRQPDPSARVIWLLERVHLVDAVRCPRPGRLARLAAHD